MTLDELITALQRLKEEGVSGVTEVALYAEGALYAFNQAKINYKDDSYEDIVVELTQC